MHTSHGYITPTAAEQNAIDAGDMAGIFICCTIYLLLHLPAWWRKQRRKRQQSDFNLGVEVNRRRKAA